MALLVMDTATEVLAAGVALTAGLAPGQGGDVEAQGWGPASMAVPVTASTAVRVPRGHSRLLQPALAQVLEHAGIRPQDLTGIGVGVGPGSYTGVRLAVSTAKAMAFALGIPVYPLSTLAAMAAAAAPFANVGGKQAPLRVVSLLYARRQRAFGAVFEYQGGGVETLVPPQVRHLGGWLEVLAQLRHQRGPGTELLVHDFQPQFGGDDEIQALSTDWQVTLADCAGNLAAGLIRVWLAGDTQPLAGDAVHRLEPAYVLEVEAEAKLRGATERVRAEK